MQAFWRWPSKTRVFLDFCKNARIISNTRIKLREKCCFDTECVHFYVVFCRRTLGWLGKHILTLFALFSLLGHVFGRACSRQIDAFLSPSRFSRMSPPKLQMHNVCIFCCYLRYSRFLGMALAKPGNVEFGIFDAICVILASWACLWWSLQTPNLFILVAIYVILASWACLWRSKET